MTRKILCLVYLLFGYCLLGFLSIEKRFESNLFAEDCFFVMRTKNEGPTHGFPISIARARKLVSKTDTASTILTEQEFDSCDFFHDVPLNDSEFFFQESYYVYSGEKDHDGTAVPQYKLSPAIRNLVTVAYKNAAGQKLTADLEIWAETAD